MTDRVDDLRVSLVIDDKVYRNSRPSERSESYRIEEADNRRNYPDRVTATMGNLL
jgi:hypothetical protein